MVLNWWLIFYPGQPCSQSLKIYWDFYWDWDILSLSVTEPGTRASLYLLPIIGLDNCLLRQWYYIEKLFSYKYCLIRYIYLSSVPHHTCCRALRLCWKTLFYISLSFNLTFHLLSKTLFVFHDALCHVYQWVHLW